MSTYLNSGVVHPNQYRDLALTEAVYAKVLDPDQKVYVRKFFSRNQLRNVRVGQIIDVVEAMSDEDKAKYEGVDKAVQMIVDGAKEFLKQKEAFAADRSTFMKKKWQERQKNKIQLPPAAPRKDIQPPADHTDDNAEAEKKPVKKRAAS